MLHYSKEFLWKHFCSKYTHCSSLEIDYEVNSWNNKRKISVSNPWLSASYLIDISDDKEIIKNDFTALVNTYKPTTVLLLTSAQPKKKELLASLSTEFKTIGYKTDEVLSSRYAPRADLRPFSQDPRSAPPTAEGGPQTIRSVPPVQPGPETIPHRRRRAITRQNSRSRRVGFGVTASTCPKITH